jgi:hypothetical protein
MSMLIWYRSRRNPLKRKTPTLRIGKWFENVVAPIAADALTFKMKGGVPSMPPPNEPSNSTLRHFVTIEAVFGSDIQRDVAIN